MVRQQVDQRINESVQEVAALFPEIQLVYLFGSQVEGAVGPLSDYDFGIVLVHSADEQALRARICHAFVKRLGTPRVDVVLLQRAPIELAYAAIALGVLLFERTKLLRVEFEAYVMGRYGDYLPVLRAHRRDIIRGENRAARIQRYRTALERTERTLGQIATTAGEKSQ